MSIKLELDADSIKKAISNHISNQGFDLAGKTVEVALVNGRGGNGNRATITISDDVKVENKKVEDIDAYIKTPVNNVDEDVKEIANAVTEAPVELPKVRVEETIEIEQEDIIIPNLDPIMAAAEGASNPFGSDAAGLFPSIEPGDVKTSKSLF